MIERPILFSAPMIRALLDGTKTQTRRIVKPRPTKSVATLHHTAIRKRDGLLEFTARDRRGQAVAAFPVDEHSLRAEVICPYGTRGDRLWVREAFTHITGNGIRVHYRSDGEPLGRDGCVLPTEPGLRRWMPSIFMPRKLSRITLDLSDVRVQRLQNITEADARAEGVEPFFTRFPDIGRDQRITDGRFARDEEHRASYAVLWDEINGDRALWSSNPWVWALTFKRVEPTR